MRSSLVFDNKDVQIEAAQAYVSFLSENYGDMDVIRPLSELYPPFLEVVKEVG